VLSWLRWAEYRRSLWRDYGVGHAFWAGQVCGRCMAGLHWALVTSLVWPWSPGVDLVLLKQHTHYYYYPIEGLIYQVDDRGDVKGK
jgi:hypothetical protein